LTTQLLVSTEHGKPIAPIQAHLKTAEGYLSTAATVPPKEVHHLEQVLPMMHDADAMTFPTTLVHMIDREADSVFHFRKWSAAGFLFLVRSDDNRIVRWNGKEVKYQDIESALDLEGAFRMSREVSIQGKPGVQYVAEAQIILDRPAQHRVNGCVQSIPGEALSLRLVIARVVDPQSGEVLSTWYLLTNVPDDVPSEAIALWYYWRWEIESYFKLMKSGGQQLEHWQQESGLAVLKRVLVASMACSVVWSLQCAEDAPSVAFKSVLVRLSGKRVARGRSPTPGVLLSGLFVLLQMVDFLIDIDVDLSKVPELQTFLRIFRPTPRKDV
jgi:hypothetical protein